MRRLPVSHPPSSAPVDLRIEGAGVDFRLRKSHVPGWAWVPILALFSAVSTGIVTYYQTLRAAGARVAAVEELARLQAEQIARLRVRVDAAHEALDHEVSVNRSQDSQLGRLNAPLVVKP